MQLMMPRHTGQRLPFIAAAVSLLIIGGGAVFAQTSNECSRTSRRNFCNANFANVFDRQRFC